MKTAILAAALAVASTPALAWQTQDVATPIDGRSGVMAYQVGWIEDEDMPLMARLVIVCNKNSTDVYVDPMQKQQPIPWEARMRFAYHSYSGTAIRYKVNNGPIDKATWGASLDNDAFGLWSGAGIGWLKTMAKADNGEPVKLTIEARGMRGDSSFSFDITGIKAALAPIAKQCGWSL